VGPAVRRALVLVALAACSIRAVDYTGKDCPCPDGYLCETQSQTCVRNAVSMSDARQNDARGDSNTSGASCLPNPRTNVLDSQPTLASFPTGWALVTGMWMRSGNDLHQTSSVALALTLRFVQSFSSNYRVVATMYSPELGGGDIGIAFRGAGSVLYHCTFDPVVGTLEMHLSQTVSEEQLGAVQLAPQDPSDMPFTMEIQTIGSQHACCVRGRSQVLTATDATNSLGDPGFATRDGAGRFSSFFVYQ
jgi:hypothetical protein